MSERRFAIFETKDSSYAPVWVTESELKRRLELFSDEAFVRNEGFDEIIRILFHGEGKEEPCPYCKLVHKDTDTCMGYPEQPDPWEAWVEEMPQGRMDSAEYLSLQQWFRKMPKEVK